MFGLERDAAGCFDRMRASMRAENAAAGERLAAISELDLMVLRKFGEKETWCSDTQSLISVEIAAALRISTHWAASYLYYARAMRNRLPKVGALLAGGEIGYATFKTIVYRTDLITEPEILAAVDATLAAKAARWPSMTTGRLAGYVDKVVWRADRDAVRRRRERHADREITIWDSGNGMAGIQGTLISSDAQVLEARLAALAATVCAEDPRTNEQRHADALGALAAGAQRLQCRCGRPDCPNAAAVPVPVVIHVVADAASVAGGGQTPGVVLGSEELIPPELLAQLAESARLQPVTLPIDAPPEPGYTPSRGLADFIRCRDLTCRAPGCDRPAIECQIDHTTPFSAGGLTHASNLKLLCREHHLMKTFWNWSDRQLADGTVIWTAPTGQAYITTPGSALLFPMLMTPTGDIDQPAQLAQPAVGCADRTLAMPTRRRTRAESHARYVAAERCRNRAARHARQAAVFGPTLPRSDPDDDPPPF